MTYQHLTYYERVEIEFLRRRGFSLRAIGERMGRSPSTISRELRRNADKRGRYLPLKAQEKSIVRQKRSGRKPALAFERLRSEVQAGLVRDWSPEQIAGRLRVDYPDDSLMRISHESIYLHIYAEKKRGGTLYTHLRQARRQRRRRLRSKGQRGLIRNRVGIEERPAIADTQTRFGDFEGDTIFGKQSGPPILTLNDRKTLYTLAVKMRDKSAASLNDAFLQAYIRLGAAPMHTLTVDNGKEFAAFKEIEEISDTRVYFARPYTATDRAINENINGLLRQYLPKGADFTTLEQDDLNSIIDMLNNRPRKKLGYRTPKEAFGQETVALHD